MDAAQMMRQIESAVADEQRSHRLRSLLAQVAQANGRRPTRKELDDAVQFVIDYIKHVPLLMMAMHAAAQQLKVQAAVQPLLDGCEQYWFAGIDLIPDHHGLLGYMDDAYYVLSILQEIAERYRQPNGEPLMNMRLRPSNQTMRGLIGEPHASILDAAVGQAVAGPSFSAMLQNLPYMGRPLVDRDPIWGNASIDEIVNARMGALGIV
ncbi:MAG TPA: YkvA family protein [Gemmatimonadales bacterium]|nr:YkvA family protein [Gemmatimonadales bacterium]